MYDALTVPSTGKSRLTGLAIFGYISTASLVIRSTIVICEPLVESYVNIINALCASYDNVPA